MRIKQTVSPVRGRGLVNQNEEIDTLYQEAHAARSLDEKRIRYNYIYQILRTDPTLNLQQLFRLFEEYASVMCYAKTNPQTGDDEEGFRKSASLMELSFNLQLYSMELETLTFDWKRHENLEDLITNLGIQKDQKSVLFDMINDNINTTSSDVLMQKADNSREILAKTLLKLSYSYQNIDATNGSAYLALHQKLNALTEKAIGEENDRQKAMMIDFRYNRCLFLARLANPDDFESHLNSYNSVQELAKGFYPSDSPKYISLLAQIGNMRGILVLRKIPTLKDNSGPIYLAMAQGFFNIALKLRETLTQLDPQNKENEYLYANLRTCIIHCLVSAKPLTKENMNEAVIHRNALQDYLGKGDNAKHSYAESWIESIEKVDAAVLAFGIIQ